MGKNRYLSVFLHVDIHHYFLKCFFVCYAEAHMNLLLYDNALVHRDLHANTALDFFGIYMESWNNIFAHYLVQIYSEMGCLLILQSFILICKFQ